MTSADERNKISLFLYMTRGEGVKKSENFAYIIYGSPLVVINQDFHEGAPGTKKGPLPPHPQL